LSWLANIILLLDEGLEICFLSGIRFWQNALLVMKDVLMLNDFLFGIFG
jgi:hypothetical protein